MQPRQELSLALRREADFERERHVVVERRGSLLREALYAKGRSLGDFHRAREAAAIYDELMTRYADDADPWIENLFHDARTARRHLDKWWWRLTRGL